MTLGLNRLVSMVAVVAAIVLGPLLLGSGFMVMLPALILVLPLIGGRYVGERAVFRARRAIAKIRVRIARPIPLAVVDSGWGASVRGGRLIAASLATRPPPLSA